MITPPQDCFPSALKRTAQTGALDIAGGPQSARGWLMVFIVLAAGIAAGPLALLRARRKHTQDQPA